MGKFVTILCVCLFSILTLLNSCTKSILHQLEGTERQVYLTGRAPYSNFSQYSSFSMVDSVLNYRNNNGFLQLQPEDLVLLQTIRTNMIKRGYKEIERNQLPDLGINVTKIDKQTSGIFLEPTPGAWANLPGYWNSGYWGSSGGYEFPQSFYVINTSEEIIIIDLLDLKNLDSSTDPIKVIWNVQLRGPGIMESQATASGVISAFEQSPYLKTP